MDLSTVNCDLVECLDPVTLRIEQSGSKRLSDAERFLSFSPSPNKYKYAPSWLRVPGWAFQGCLKQQWRERFYSLPSFAGFNAVVKWTWWQPPAQVVTARNSASASAGYTKASTSWGQKEIRACTLAKLQFHHSLEKNISTLGQGSCKAWG